MMMLACLAGLIPLIVAAVLFWHDVPLTVRIALVGIYALIGTVAVAAVAILLRLDALLMRVKGGAS
jgi:hypothetical protein